MLLSWRTSPFTVVQTRSPVGSKASASPSTGPTGQKVSKLLPRHHCDPPRSTCHARADTSFAATYLRRVTRRAVCWCYEGERGVTHTARQALVAHEKLHCCARSSLANPIPEHIAERVLRTNVLAVLCDDDAELDLVVYLKGVLCALGHLDGPAVARDAGRVLEKDHGEPGLRHAALSSMGLIV